MTDFQRVILCESPFKAGRGWISLCAVEAYFFAEGITVSDLVANKISGSGSCLIGKLQNSPHNCETRCCPARRQQEGSHRAHMQLNPDKRTVWTVYFALTIWLAVLCCCRSVQLTLKSRRRQSTLRSNLAFDSCHVFL